MRSRQVELQAPGVQVAFCAVMRCTQGSVAQAAMLVAPVALAVPHLSHVHVPVVATVATLLQRRFVWQSAPDRHLMFAPDVVMELKLLAGRPSTVAVGVPSTPDG